MQKIDTIRLRVAVGILGLLLPWIVVPLVGQFPPSISATWYTVACTPFMIILGAASILLMCYKGYEKIDDIINTLTGAAGLGICLFPCSFIEKDGTNYLAGMADTITRYAYDIDKYQLVGPFRVPMNISNIIHTVCAVIFFGLLAYNSIFLFTKSKGEMTRNKKIRNIIYRVCGVGMVASFLILLLPDFYIKVWLMEAIALFFFALSFLTKADVFPFLFCDTPFTDEEPK